MSINEKSSHITAQTDHIATGKCTFTKSYHLGHMEKMIVLSIFTKNTLIFKSLVQTYKYCTGIRDN